jgi:hypothetical protein
LAAPALAGYQPRFAAVAGNLWVEVFAVNGGQPSDASSFI